MVGGDCLHRQSADERETEFWLTLEKLATQGTTDPKVARLADSVLRDPEMSLEERAQSFGITERTLRDWHQRLLAHLKGNR